LEIKRALKPEKGKDSLQGPIGRERGTLALKIEIQNKQENSPSQEDSRKKDSVIHPAKFYLTLGGGEKARGRGRMEKTIKLMAKL